MKIFSVTNSITQIHTDASYQHVDVGSIICQIDDYTYQYVIYNQRFERVDYTHGNKWIRVMMHDGSIGYIHHINIHQHCILVADV